jgi:GMP synthase (glutamine-hydrolysing)
MEPRLKTRIVVQAALRTSTMRGIAMVVARHGDDDAGTIILKINRRDLGCSVLVQTRTPTGELAWLRAVAEASDEAAADAYIARQVQRDPDLWVVEIDDRAGRSMFEGRIL